MLSDRQIPISTVQSSFPSKPSKSSLPSRVWPRSTFTLSMKQQGSGVGGGDGDVEGKE